MDESDDENNREEFEQGPHDLNALDEIDVVMIDTSPKKNNRQSNILKDFNKLNKQKVKANQEAANKRKM